MNIWRLEFYLAKADIVLTKSRRPTLAKDDPMHISQAGYPMHAYRKNGKIEKIRKQNNI